MASATLLSVISAQAGIQKPATPMLRLRWIPACAGMTGVWIVFDDAWFMA
jgi:hypothetical protein